jgi:peptide/nickel transport system permease protein
VSATRALGARRSYLLRSELLPAVVPSVTRHAVLRLPGIALALASLSFLGLGAQPPTPEWGLLLAENQPYAERAPWAVLTPAAVLALLGALAVTAAGAGGRGRDGGAGARRRTAKAARAQVPAPQSELVRVS